MKKLILITTAAVLTLGTLGVTCLGALRPARAAGGDPDYTPELKKKIVPILTFGSSLNVGVAQVQGEERDVNRVKVVAQLETDYKDAARIKILVPVQSEDVVKHIDRVPGVSVSALADYAVKK
jgi:hypothetical protein